MRPQATTVGRYQAARRVWVDKIRSSGQDLLAVHTLRNWATAASFLASTAILICLGVISAVFARDRLSEAAGALNLLGQTDTTTWTVKLLVLLVLFMSAFLNFSMAIRSFNHVAFLVAIPTGDEIPLPDNAAADELVNGALHYTLGMRSYYISIPAAFWLFGPTWMLISTLVLLIGLWKIDFPRPKGRLH